MAASLGLSVTFHCFPEWLFNFTVMPLIHLVLLSVFCSTFCSFISISLSFFKKYICVKGIIIPTCCAGNETPPVTGRGHQLAEWCSGCTLLLLTWAASWSRVPRETESWLPVGDCQRISCPLPCQGTAGRIIRDRMFVCPTNVYVNSLPQVCAFPK